MPGILIKNVEYQGVVGDYIVPPKRTGLVQVGDYERVINAKGLIVVPAFYDQHVHFRDPGFTEKEDLLSGARAAAAGGYCRVRCEPNTRPVIDTQDAVNEFQERVKSLDIPLSINTKCALTLGQQGEELVDIPAICDKSYVFSFSSDGEPVVDRDMLITAFRLSHVEIKVHDDIMQIDTTIDLHCEETPHSTQRLRAVLGDGPAYAREPELIRLALSALSEAGHGSLHIQHVSMAESIDLIRKFKETKGEEMNVTAEVTPHHLLLCEEDIPLRNGECDPNWKMNPPLRSRADMLALRKALADGVIDEIATDHAPHTPAEKARSWDEAPFGVIGLETAFGACMKLVQGNELTFDRLVSAMTQNLPMKYAFGLNLVDQQQVWTVDPNKFYSKGRNCPFAGMTFKGKPMYTIAGGRVVMAEGEVLF